MLRQSCPNTISRSGEKGKRISCYVIYLKTGGYDELLLVKGIDKTGFSGLRWNGNRFDEPGSIPFTETQNVSIEIERYIGLFSFTYSSVVQCVLRDWSYFNRIPIMWEWLCQFFFSWRDLGLTKRIETLQALVQESFDAPAVRCIRSIATVTATRSQMGSPPGQHKTTELCEALLASLEESGELKKDGTGFYRTIGKALTTLSLYETEKQRHEQMLSQSRHMKWLTLALILVGAANAIVTYVVSNGR